MYLLLIITSAMLICCPPYGLRSTLADYRFSKSQRKHLRSLHKRYDVQFSPLVLTQEHEVLYQRYLTVAKGDRSTTVEGVLGDVECVVFQSQMLEVRDPGRQ